MNHSADDPDDLVRKNINRNRNKNMSKFKSICSYQENLSNPVQIDLIYFMMINRS